MANSPPTVARHSTAKQMLALAGRATRLRWLSALSISMMSFWSVLALADPGPQEFRTLSPPINHEVGRIETVLAAADGGYRYRAYVLTWRSMRIVVAGRPEESRVPGSNLDIVVSRTDADGHRVLHFVPDSSFSNEDEGDLDSGSSAEIIQATAPIEEALFAESDGYRFVGYFVTWHEQRVFVIDPRAAAQRGVGETINFRVLRTGRGASQRLSFSI